jgi:hypothetical protein
VILSIFVNQKPYKNFPRKEFSNFSRILREFNNFNWTCYFLIIFLYQSGMREGWARDQKWKGMGRRGTEDRGGMNGDRRETGKDRIGTGKGQERDRRGTGEGRERDGRGTGEGQERDRRGIGEVQERDRRGT